jgi:predicted exporter
MFHIAAGVCLGILAAVLILNWWQAHLVRRAERRERKAYRKMMRAYEMPPDPYQNQAVDRFAGLFILGILGFSFLVAVIGH